MSMNATFVQVDTAELSRFQADPGLVEALFDDSSLPKPLGALTETMQDRIRTFGPGSIADAIARLDPELQRKIAERVGVAGRSSLPASPAASLKRLPAAPARRSRFRSFGTACISSYAVALMRAPRR
jgi:hypothetical protein